MSEVDASIFQHLRENVKGGFDEERFGPRIGFNNLKKCVRAHQPRSVGLLNTPCVRALASLATG